MLNRILAVCIVLASCKQDRLVYINPECGTKCYPHEHISKAGVGVCSWGVLKCADDRATTCEGYVLPSQSKCDGRDNDCDGKLDSAIDTCKTACGIGNKYCTAGVWGECSTNKPTQEVCDGLDNDCDGIVDNVVYTDPYCYGGPVQTIAKGECRAGFKACVNKQEICYGQVLPTPEVCDAKDNDCDGIVDNGTSQMSYYDFVIIMDDSCSMGSVSTKLKSVTTNWAVKYASQSNIRFALVGAPTNETLDDTKVKVVTDLVGAAAFMSSVIQNTGSAGSGNEPTYDAIKMVEDPANPLKLSWGTNSRKTIIMFTDEEGQSYNFTPPLDGPTLTNWIDSLQTKIPIVLYTDMDPSVYNTYKTVIAATSGTIDNVSMSEVNLGLQLDALITDRLCK